MNQIFLTPFSKQVIYSSIGLVFCWIVVVVLLGDRGVDLTDEVYSINLIREFQTLNYATSYIGIFWSPILSVSSSLHVLRVTNLLVLLGAAFAAFYVALEQHKPKANRLRALVSIGLSISTLAVVDGWQLSPSYNSTNLLGMMLLITTFVLAIRRGFSLSFLVPVAVSFAIIFLAKPTSAIFAGLSFAIYLVTKIGFGKAVSRIAFVGTLSIGLSFAALWAYGLSPTDLIQRFALGGAFLGSIEAGYRFPDPYWDLRQIIWSVGFVPDIFFLSVFGMSILPVFMQLEKFRVKPIRVSLLASFLFLGFLLLVINYEVSYWKSVPFFIVPLALYVYLVFSLRRNYENPYDFVREISSSLFAASLIPAFVIGTNTHFLMLAAEATVLFLLAIVLLPKVKDLKIWSLSNQSTVMSLISLVALSVGWVTLVTSLNQPFRQIGSVLTMDSTIEFDTIGSVKLEKSAAELLRSYKSISGVKSGCVLDLSGESHGLALVTGGSNCLTYWTLRYPGINDGLEILLDDSDLDLGTAQFILDNDVERNALPRSIREELDFEKGELLGSYRGREYYIFGLSD